MGSVAAKYPPPTSQAEADTLKNFYEAAGFTAEVRKDPGWMGTKLGEEWEVVQTGLAGDESEAVEAYDAALATSGGVPPGAGVPIVLAGAEDPAPLRETAFGQEKAHAPGAPGGTPLAELQAMESRGELSGKLLQRVRDRIVAGKLSDAAASAVLARLSK